jgi:hypothetical protein
MEIKVELTEEQCAAVLKLLNACSPLRASSRVQFQSPASRARYEAASAILGEWQFQSQKPEAELMNVIESLEEV